jgi:hypothetical protein
MPDGGSGLDCKGFGGLRQPQMGRFSSSVQALILGREMEKAVPSEQY